ncbi:hypothetical protein GCM10023195_24200 [Actinoallomurus liliacearum]|uniref:Anti-sigma-D factor RsdA sigma factor binding region domain-containing protein n=1 Tax=Actinoallomurus liliacearum TaxID=1080073 RepID=A0ABP8TF14_9ACTN
MTEGGSATPEPLDLSEITRSGDLFDALAARRVTDPGSGSAVSDDPAARLLAALVADVDTGAPPLPGPARVSRATSKTSGRPVVRAFVTFGAVAVMLTTAGAAVAVGGGGGGPKAHAPSARHQLTERSKARIESVGRALPSGPRPTVDRTPADKADPTPTTTKASGPHTPEKGRGSAFAGPPSARQSGSPSATPTPTPTPSPSAGTPTESPSPVSTSTPATPQPDDTAIAPQRRVTGAKTGAPGRTPRAR